MQCPYCNNGTLKRTQWDWTKYNRITPVFNSGKRMSYTIAMLYECLNKDCNKVVSGRDGQLIHNLPYFVTSSYPIDSRYAVLVQRIEGQAKSTTFHISKSMSFLLESTMVTYTSGSFNSKFLLQQEETFHSQKVRKYYESVKAFKNLSFHDK